MKKLIFVFASLFFVQNGFSQNLVLDGGKFGGNLHWSGKVTIRGDIVILPTGRLVIDPGTEIRFAPVSDKSKSGTDKTRCELIIRGSIIAKGKLGEKIKFTSLAESPRMSDWYGIQFLHIKTQSIIDFCVIEYAYTGLTIKNSAVQISNSEIRYNFHSGITAEVKAKPTIARNIISENDYAGVICSLGAIPVLTENLITLNRIGLVAFSSAQPNLGDLRNGANYNPGKNRILENEDFNIYNHSNKSIFAENNAWGTTQNAEIVKKLFDKNNNSKYGNIDFQPLMIAAGEESNLDNFLLLTQNIESQTPQRTNSISAVNPQQQRLTENDLISNEQEPLTQTNQNENKSDTTSIDENLVLETLHEQEPLLASARPEETNDNIYTPIEELAQQINYDEIFLEPFLDNGNKQYIYRGKIKMNEVIRSVMRSGEIRIRVVVRKDGTVESAKIMRGINEVLDNVAMETVQHFRYRPGKLNGIPVRFSTMEVFVFK